jgi:hypothetical protein
VEQGAREQRRKQKVVLAVLVRDAYRCAHSKKWINIKHHWTLSVTSAERSARKQMLSTCG